MILGICDSPAVLEVMLIVTKVITIIRIAVPILLIISLMIGFAKAVSNNDNDALEKAKKASVSKVIAAVLVFLIPTFVDVIVGIVNPNSEYKECLSDISSETVDKAYDNNMEKLLGSAETNKNLYDYYNAQNYLENIKDSSKKQYYQRRLEDLKKEIDYSKKVSETKSESKNGQYSKVNYNNFKWRYYYTNRGPISEVYSKSMPYAIYAPENKEDLNGVSLPLIIWLHGGGEIKGEDFTKVGLPKIINKWGQTNLQKIPAIIIAPHSGGEWKQDHHFEMVKQSIEWAKSYYNIDLNNVVLMGHSMGGRGTVFLSYGMYKKYSKNYFSAIVSMSSNVYKEYPEDDPTSGYNYFSKMKMRCYGEAREVNGFYNWLGKANEYIYLKNTSHGDVPYVALTTDENKDGVSDLMYWLFHDDASTTQKEEPTQITPSSTTPESSTPGSTTPSNPKPTPDPIINHVNIASVNKTIANAAKSGGLYTRGGVVNVATTLVETLASSNYHIPYQLGGMYHRGKAWGLNSGWGTVITHNNKYVLSGLDCRNFVNWTFKQAGLSLIRGFGYEGAINNKYGDTYPNIGDGRPGDVIDASEHIMLIIKNDKANSSYLLAESNGGYGVRLKTYKYSELQGSIKYRAYNMDGVYNNTGIWCSEKSSYRAYSGSCHIPKSEFPSYY